MAEAAPTDSSAEVPAEPDLAHFVQRRRLDQYEQAIARQGYAYGVDVRRAQWLARSSLGNAAVRAVDRAWTGMSKSLMDDTLSPADLQLPRVLIAKLTQFRALLSAPKPALWSLREGQERADWAPVTPLGPARAGARWLVVDPQQLAEIDDHVQNFWLAAGLAHLQCGHAVFYTAHRLVHAGRAPKRVQWLQRAARPWSRVMAFSSDRAGLLACENLELALDALQQVHAKETQMPWLPSMPDLDLRRQALEEFERSVVVARVRAARANQDQPARVVGAPQAPDADSSDPAQSADAEDDKNAAPPYVPADAWSVARCDQRLTERLGLL